jgi:O-antigen ligase
MQVKRSFSVIKFSNIIDLNKFFVLFASVILVISPLGYSYELKFAATALFFVVLLFSMATGTYKKISLTEIYVFLFSILAVSFTVFRDPEYSVAGIFDLIGMACFFLAVYRITNDVDAWRFLGYAYIAGCLYASSLTIINWATGTGVQSRFSANELVNANFVAYSIATAMSVIIGLIWSQKNITKLQNYSFILITVIFGISIFLTGCRGAAVGYIFGLVLYVARIFSLKLETGIRLIFAITITVIIVNFALPDSLKDRFYLVEAYAGQDLTAGRIDQWPVASDLIQLEPVFGNGPDAFSAISVGNLQVHNAFLGVTIAFGALGMVIYTLIVQSACGIFQPRNSDMFRWSGLVMFFVWLPIALTGVWAYSIPAFFGFAWIYRVKSLFAK